MQIVLLAAGKSSRMGTNKLALLYKDKPLLIHSLEAALDFSSHVVLVTGYYREQTLSILKEYRYEHHRALHIVHNNRPSEGQFSSTLTGLKEISGDDCCAIALSDSPLIRKEHYLFLEEHLESHDGVRVFHRSTPGHPMLCSADLVQQAKHEDIHSTMRSFLVGKDINNIESDDPSWILDVDTMPAYRKLLSL
ncbi:MAG: nucleotidyltransferase family protein [Sphaerochaetaceae bacterium]|nr:nucleotidyltransferase family protein [Sphaerochaetaceae bacterium]MDC7247981.1 nucleotidyltransferase family protein [Sphaerochaetaceae bacterium]